MLAFTDILYVFTRAASSTGPSLKMDEEAFPTLDLPKMACELCISSGLLFSHCATLASEWVRSASRGTYCLMLVVYVSSWIWICTACSTGGGVYTCLKSSVLER